MCLQMPETMGAEFFNRSKPSSISPNVGVRGRYTDRPTITYDPLMGAKFTRSLIAPIPMAGILVLIQAGYPCCPRAATTGRRRSGLYQSMPPFPSSSNWASCPSAYRPASATGRNRPKQDLKGFAFGSRPLSCCPNYFDKMGSDSNFFPLED